MITNNIRYTSVGFCRMDITPPLGIEMQGYYYERRSEGVLDPLYVNALAIKEGQQVAVVLTCDLLGIYNETDFVWHQEIARTLGLSADAVFLCHTHTHTGPKVDDGLISQKNTEKSSYDKWFFTRLCDAATMALNDCKPVSSIRAWEGLCEGICFVRRFKMTGGYYQTWANYLDPNIEGYACKGDESVRFARIARDGGEELILVNFQCHPDNVSGNLISADYPAFLRRTIEKEKPNTKCIFFNGAEGQLVCNDWWHDSVIRTKYEIAIHVGKKLAEVILENYDCAVQISDKGISFGQMSLSCRTKYDPARNLEAKQLVSLHEAGKDDEIGPDWVATPLIAEAYKIIDLNSQHLEYLPIVVSAITIGGLALLGIAGEPFCEIGQTIRKESPFESTMVCCQTNGAQGYYPVAEAYDQGGYEPRNTPFIRGVGEQIIDAGINLLKSLCK